MMQTEAKLDGNHWVVNGKKTYITGAEGAKVGIMSYGSSARSAKAAINQAEEEGIAVDFVRPITLWPFPTQPTIEMAEKVDAIVVPEMNLGQMIDEVERCIGGKARVVGVNRVDGDPITPGDILAKIREVA